MSNALPPWLQEWEEPKEPLILLIDDLQPGPSNGNLLKVLHDQVNKTMQDKTVVKVPAQQTLTNTLCSALELQQS